jgi:hypothetical protein
MQIRCKIRLCWTSIKRIQFLGHIRVDGEEKPGKMDSSSDTRGNEPFFFPFFLEIASKHLQAL